MTIDTSFQQAVAKHQAGQLQEAAKLYQAVLQLNPNHPEANHNMGVLSVQMKHPVLGLPYFTAALDADPTRPQFWLSYIDAIAQAGQLEDARQVLALARQQGLQGNEVDALALRLEGDETPGSADTGQHLPLGESAPTSSRVLPSKPGEAFREPVKPGMSAKKIIPQQGKQPSAQKINSLAAMFGQGRYTEAAALAQVMTKQFPKHGFGWKVLGAALKQMGRNTDALESMQKAAALAPDDAEAHSNLGAILQTMGRLDGAANSFRHALRINPGFAQAYFNLGSTLQLQGCLKEAEDNYRRAIQSRPDFAEAHDSLGVVLQGLDRFEEAENSHRRALQIKPDFAEAHSNLGMTLQRLGRPEESLTHFQKRAELTPGNEVALHQIASLTGQTTERAPNQYVEIVFDNYADKFDTHLQQVLQYDVPGKLVGLIRQHLPSAEKWDVLDLGCGTGLVGVEIARFSRQMVGVDLSAKMLTKAQARNLYQRLERSELLGMMQAEQASSYDSIIAADVFIYLGKLDAVIGEIKRLLRSGGVLAFSIETPEIISNAGDLQGGKLGYQLKNTGRYGHSVEYMTQLASANDFLIQELVATQIRTEKGQPIHGYVCLWKK